MAIVTISRQYGSGGDEIATRVCEMLGYRYFDKSLMAQAISEAGLPESEIVDFSEDNYIAVLDEAQSIALVQAALQAVAKQGNVVIVGRGGQAVLKTRPGVLHVRIQAPLEARTERISQQENSGLFAARETVVKHDQATADYLKRFYGVDWADTMLYDLVINTGTLNIDAAAHLVAHAVNVLAQPESPTQAGS